MIYDVSHRTTYRYSQPVSISNHVLHLRPRASDHQICHRSVLTIDPTPALCSPGQDYFNNPVMFVAVQDEHTELAIHARSRITVEKASLPDPAGTPAWDTVAGLVQGDLTEASLDAAQFAFDSPYTTFAADLAGYARTSFAPGRPILEAALDLTRRIFTDFTYDGTATNVTTPVDEVYRIRRGVCQDFAHLQLACLRALALPARYVSGYLRTYPPDGQERLIGADASHAWLSIWCPGHGWIDLDPTNDTIPSIEHITLAWGRDYGDVSPINGVMYGGGAHIIDVEVDVEPVFGDGISAP